MSGSRVKNVGGTRRLGIEQLPGKICREFEHRPTQHRTAVWYDRIFIIFSCIGHSHLLVF